MKTALFALAAAASCGALAGGSNYNVVAGHAARREGAGPRMGRADAQVRARSGARPGRHPLHRGDAGQQDRALRPRDAEIPRMGPAGRGEAARAPRGQAGHGVLHRQRQRHDRQARSGHRQGGRIQGAFGRSPHTLVQATTGSSGSPSRTGASAAWIPRPGRSPSTKRAAGRTGSRFRRTAPSGSASFRATAWRGSTRRPERSPRSTRAWQRAATRRRQRRRVGAVVGVLRLQRAREIRSRSRRRCSSATSFPAGRAAAPTR
jgi:hypothetical protein